MSKDILGVPIVEDQLVLYAMSGGPRLLRIAGKVKPDAYAVDNIPPGKRRLTQIGTKVTNVLALVLEPFLDRSNTEVFEPSPGNIKGRTDMTGLALKPGQIVAHVKGLPRGGYYLKISQVVEYGPRGGAQVQPMRKYGGKLVVVESKPSDYVGDCLVLNENLANRLIKFRLNKL